MIYLVSGYELVRIWGKVEADTEEEAIKKGFHNEWIDETIDTEPEKNIWPNRWTAEKT